MALVVATLNSKLLELLSNSDEFPKTYEEAGEKWANAVNAYASLVTPPSTTSALATQTFVATWIASKPLQSLDILVESIVAYAGVLATGMAPTFVATPPPVSEGLSQGLSALGEATKQGGSVQSWASTASALIDAYFKTGIAVNPITGVSITWL